MEIAIPIFETELTCQRCAHRWVYRGCNHYVCCCPHCHTTVREGEGFNAIMQEWAVFSDLFKITNTLNRHLEEPNCTDSLREIIADIVGSENKEENLRNES